MCAKNQNNWYCLFHVKYFMSGKYFTCNGGEMTMVVVEMVVMVVEKNNGEVAMKVKKVIVVMIVDKEVLVEWQ